MSQIEIGPCIKKRSCCLLLHVRGLISIFIVLLVILIIIILIAAVVWLRLVILKIFFISVKAQRTVKNFQTNFFGHHALIWPEVVYNFDGLRRVNKTRPIDKNRVFWLKFRQNNIILVQRDSDGLRIIFRTFLYLIAMSLVWRNVFLKFHYYIIIFVH